MYTLAQKRSADRLTDEDMIQQVFPHQPDRCFALLYQRYVGKVYRRCLSLTHNTERAQDFTQDIFLKVFSKLNDFEQRARFSTWLYAVCYNYCADQLRLEKRLALTSLDVLLANEPADLPADCSHEESWRIVEQVMETLSSQDQILLWQKYEDGLSIAELAKLHGLTLSTVKMRLKRSRDKIQRLSSQHLN